MKKIFLLATILLFCTKAFAAADPSKVQTEENLSLPQWVTKPTSFYNQKNYLTGVGFGKDDQSAEDSAKAQLIQTLTQSIVAEEKSELYADSTKEFSTYTSNINTSSEIKNISGLSIAQKYYEAENKVYALAVLKRQDAASYYSTQLKNNDAKITSLINSALSKTGEIQSCIEAQNAYNLALQNEYYADLITVINPPVAVDTTLTYDSALEVKTIADQIKSQVKIKVQVAGYDNKTIESSLKKVYQKAGLPLNNDDLSNYTLNATLDLKLLETSDTKHVFYNYAFQVELLSSDNKVYLPYSISGRAGHVNDTGAKTRAVYNITKELESKYYQSLLQFIEN